MTDTLDRETLTEIARHEGWPAISIHMSTHRAGPDVQQDPIRFKNLLKTAEETLHESMRAPDIAKLLAPAYDLLGDTAFWRGSTEGLAVFVGTDDFRVFRLDVEVPESVMVAERFSIRPVLPALGVDERFYVLALSKKCVRLLEGTRHEVHELDLTGAPQSLADALKYDEYQRQVQFHSGTPAGAAGGKRAAMFHGHGGVPDVEKSNLLRYFRLIDRGMHELLRDEDAPLLLAGVDYLMPLYKEASSYANLVDVSMAGNPDELTPAELHAEARKLLEPLFRAELTRDLEKLEALLGTGAASRTLTDILPAAHEGRVDVLFVSPQRTDWGTYDAETRVVTLNGGERSAGARDLFDLAAAQTLLHGGTIHATDEPPISAIFRY